jgi:hypothetical protein
VTTTDADQLGITYPETEGDWFTPNPSETANFISQRHVPLLQDGSYEAPPQQHEIVTNFWSKSANMAVTTAEKPDSDSGELSITAKERRRCEQLATLNEIVTLMQSLGLGDDVLSTLDQVPEPPREWQYPPPDKKRKQDSEVTDVMLIQKCIEQVRKIQLEQKELDAQIDQLKHDVIIGALAWDLHMQQIEHPDIFKNIPKDSINDSIETWTSRIRIISAEAASQAKLIDTAKRARELTRMEAINVWPRNEYWRYLRSTINILSSVASAESSQDPFQRILMLNKLVNFVQSRVPIMLRRELLAYIRTFSHVHHALLEAALRANHENQLDALQWRQGEVWYTPSRSPTVPTELDSDSNDMLDGQSTRIYPAQTILQPQEVSITPEEGSSMLMHLRQQIEREDLAMQDEDSEIDDRLSTMSTDSSPPNSEDDEDHVHILTDILPTQIENIIPAPPEASNEELPAGIDIVEEKADPPPPKL